MFEKCRREVAIGVDARVPCVLLQGHEGSCSGGDDATGFNVVPKRYEAGGREAIDQLRDAAGEVFRRAKEAGCSEDDAAFATYCWLTSRKYHLRLGLKGPPEEDRKKADWYEEMWAHVACGEPDPRRYRADYAPYERPANPQVPLPFIQDKKP